MLPSITQDSLPSGVGTPYYGRTFTYKIGAAYLGALAKSILANSRKQSTFNFTQPLYQKDLNAIAHAASDIVESFGSDSDIGKSYANLARAASETSKALAKLALYAETRRARKAYA